MTVNRNNKKRTVFFQFTFSTIRAKNEYDLTTVYFNYSELFDRYFS
uniref:Uncharacterized protein n=2 Tax=unclassified Caudoviricetes TaxID=2788787 RepID=A0A8S5QKG2_9CAUD|nr:MAG TPA: hypothetical protein [Siphoviridae sp. ct58g5]DAF88693.1 MAG TPA: hypothetical protein [Siphoviridae sp. ctxD432]